LRNISEIGNHRLSGDVVYEEILKKYSLPVTASFIGAEVDPQYLGSEQTVALARKILRLDNVEAGVHGFTHPLDWKNKLTAFYIEGYSVNLEKGVEYNAFYPKAKQIIVNQEEYLKREIEEVVDYVNTTLVPEKKQVVVQQWTGNCEPPREAIEMTDRLNIKNINGGDSRLDRLYPSYTNVAPLLRQVNGRVQVYSSNANENIYTQGWEGPFYGFRYVIETFQQTEYPSLIDGIPRRISPINIYYHFYSGEKKLSLEALKETYDYALRQNINPIFTSEYLAVVDGFLMGKIQALSDGGWALRDYGQCRTVRFDRAHQWPDLEKSKGIIGFDQWEDSLYVHLSEGNRATLYLSNETPKKIYLKSASGIVSAWQEDAADIVFMAEGFGEQSYVLANLKPKGSYEVFWEPVSEKKGAAKKRLRADKDGILEVTVQGKGKIKVRVKIN